MRQDDYAKYAVFADSLEKSFGKKEDKVVAVKGVSLRVEKGELYGIIGPDGAGKTTLFRILATLMLPDSGTAYVDGFDISGDYRLIRDWLGYMPGKFSLYPDLTVKENLEFFASVFGTTIKENYHLIKDIYERLEPFEKRKASKLSGGMKQKLALCCALIHFPDILFLDEPTTGVDPSSRREFWDMLSSIRKYGISVVVSTAYMDEASRCDRISMMSQGRFIGTGTPAEIIDSFDRRLIAVSSDEMFRLLRDLRDISDVDYCYTFGDVHHVVLREDSLASPDNLSAVLVDKFKHENVSAAYCKPTMEDCFMLYESKLV